MAVHEIGEDVMCDEICRRCDRKQQRRRRGGRRVHLPYCFMNKIKRQNTILLLPASPKWSHFLRGDLWTSSNQHHPPPTNISVWSVARQRKTLARWVGEYRSVGVGHQVKKKNNTHESIKRMCKKKKQPRMKTKQHTYIYISLARVKLHQLQTKIINHITKYKRIRKISWINE